jgi:hypothetical protein
MSDLAETILAEIRALRAEVACLKAPAKESLAMSRKEAAELAGCKSSSAFQRFTEAAKLKPYRQGKYRRADVINAINRLSIAASK